MTMRLVPDGVVFERSDLEIWGCEGLEILGSYKGTVNGLLVTKGDSLSLSYKNVISKDSTEQILASSQQEFVPEVIDSMVSYPLSPKSRHLIRNSRLC